jgi:hypothetical protein
MATHFELLSPRTGRDGKTRWLKIGAAFPDNKGDGFSLVFDALPLTDKEGACRLIMRPPMERDGDAPARLPASRGTPIALDDIPFLMEWR